MTKKEVLYTSYFLQQKKKNPILYGNLGVKIPIYAMNSRYNFLPTLIEHARNKALKGIYIIC